MIEAEDLPAPLRPGRVARVVPTRERRRQLADELYKALTEDTLSFWEHVHTLFLDRDLTRHDIRELVRRGLATTHGNYRAVVGLFGMPATDYKRFLNFLTTHDCVVDFRPYRLAGKDAAPAQGDRAARGCRGALAQAARRRDRPVLGGVRTRCSSPRCSRTRTCRITS